MTPQGDVVVSSRRYGAEVLVARDRIVWSPVPGSAAPAHWCGIPRARGVRGRQASPVEPGNPDPSYLTICAFIDRQQLIVSPPGARGSCRGARRPR